MRRRLDRPGARPGLWILELLLLAAVTTGLSACFVKDSEFFALLDEALEDLTGPSFTMLRPAQAGWVINDDYVHFNVVDPPSASGAPASGVDFGSVSATNNAQLPLERDGDAFMAGIGGLSAGAHMIEVSAADNAGNTSSTFFDFTFDPNAPVIDIPGPPPTEMRTDADMIRFDIDGSVADPHLETAMIDLSVGGPDATCGTEDDLAVEAGSGPGQAMPAMVDLIPILDGGGSFSTGFDVYNPVPPGGETVSNLFCARVGAADAAVNVDGEPNPNSFTLFVEKPIVWDGPPSIPPPPPPATDLAPFCDGNVVHDNPGESSRFDVVAGVTPPVPGAPWMAVFTGPSGSLEGDGMHSGTLDAEGMTEITQRIFAFADYDFEFTVTGEDGTEHTTSAEIVVGPEETSFECVP